MRIEKPDGQPAVGRQVDIMYYDGHYGELPIFSGKVPEPGEITLTDITDVVPQSLDLKEPYTVRIGEFKPLGNFGFKNSDGIERFTFRCPPEVGELAAGYRISKSG